MRKLRSLLFFCGLFVGLGLVLSIAPSVWSADPNPESPRGSYLYVPYDDTYSTPANTPLDVSAANGVLANDYLGGIGSAPRVFLAMPPQYGSITFGEGSFETGGNFVYTPNPGYNGTDTFTYSVFFQDSRDSAVDLKSATVTIQVGTRTTNELLVEKQTFLGDVTYPLAMPGAVSTTCVNGPALTAPRCYASRGLAGTWIFNDLPPGTYTVSETAPTITNTQLTTTIDPQTVTIGAGESKSVSVTNRYQIINDNPFFRGTVVVNITVPASGALPTSNPVLTGCLLPSFTRVGIDCRSISGQGGSRTFSLLHSEPQANPYTLYLYAPNGNWAIANPRIQVQVVPDEVTVVDVTIPYSENTPPTARDNSYLRLNSLFPFPLRSAQGIEFFTDGVTQRGIRLTRNTFGLLANDAGSNLRVTGATQPANGTLTFSEDGRFTYTRNPGYEGPDSFVYTVTDAFGATDTATAWLFTTAPPPPTATPIPPTATAAPPTATPAVPIMLTTMALPDGRVGMMYDQIIGVTGGTAPYSFSLARGVLPAGLSLNPTTGRISGVPTQAEAQSFMLQVTDAAGASAGQMYTLNIAPASTPLTLTPSELPVATVNQPYQALIGAQGGTGSGYTFAIIGGALPAGMTFDGVSGVISGVPTVEGSYPLTIIALDSGGNTGTTMMTLTVAPEGALGSS